MQSYERHIPMDLPPPNDEQHPGRHRPVERNNLPSLSAGTYKRVKQDAVISFNEEFQTIQIHAKIPPKSTTAFTPANRTREDKSIQNIAVKAGKHQAQTRNRRGRSALSGPVDPLSDRKFGTPLAGPKDHERTSTSRRQPSRARRYTEYHSELEDDDDDDDDAEYKIPDESYRKTPWKEYDSDRTQLPPQRHGNDKTVEEHHAMPFNTSESTSNGGKRKHTNLTSWRISNSVLKRVKVDTPANDMYVRESLMGISKKTGNNGPKIRYDTISQDRSDGQERSLLLCAIAVKETCTVDDAKALRYGNLGMTRTVSIPPNVKRERPAFFSRESFDFEGDNNTVQRKVQQDERRTPLVWWTCNINECRHKCRDRDIFVAHLVREHKLKAPRLERRENGSIKVKGRFPVGEFSQEEQDFWNLVDACRCENPKNKEKAASTSSSLKEMKPRSPDLSIDTIPEDKPSAGFHLDFSTLDNPEVLENFDFESFLNVSEDEGVRLGKRKRVERQGEERIGRRSRPGYRAQQVTRDAVPQMQAANPSVRQLESEADTSYDVDVQDEAPQRSSSPWLANVERQALERLQRREAKAHLQKIAKEQRRPKPVDVSFWK